MFSLDLEDYAGIHGEHAYSIRWTPSGDGTLEELINDINHYYEYYDKSICNGSTINIYSSQKAMEDNRPHPTMRLIIPQYTYLDISNVDPDILDLKVHCKNMVGAWMSDTWYVYFSAHYKLPKYVSPSANAL